MNQDRPAPRGPAADRNRDYSRERDSRTRYRSRDRDDYRRRLSRSPPRRGRTAYRDRDRVGYRSPGYDSRSRSYSRSRSRRRSRQPYFGQESREVMMDGLPVDMVEEDVGQHLPPLTISLHYEIQSCALPPPIPPLLMARS